MSSVHSDLIRRHRRALRKHIKEHNIDSEVAMRVSPRNVDLLLYLNFVRFIRATTIRSQELANEDASTEILSIHWERAAEELISKFKPDTQDPRAVDLDYQEEEEDVDVNMTST